MADADSDARQELKSLAQGLRLAATQSGMDPGTVAGWAGRAPKLEREDLPEELAQELALAGSELFRANPRAAALLAEAGWCGLLFVAGWPGMCNAAWAALASSGEEGLEMAQGMCKSGYRLFSGAGGGSGCGGVWAELARRKAEPAAAKALLAALDRADAEISCPDGRARERAMALMAGMKAGGAARGALRAAFLQAPEKFVPRSGELPENPFLEVLKEGDWEVFSAGWRASPAPLREDWDLERAAAFSADPLGAVLAASEAGADWARRALGREPGECAMSMAAANKAPGAAEACKALALMGLDPRRCGALGHGPIGKALAHMDWRGLQDVFGARPEDLVAGRAPSCWQGHPPEPDLVHAVRQSRAGAGDGEARLQELFGAASGPLAAWEAGKAAEFWGSAAAEAASSGFAGLAGFCLGKMKALGALPGPEVLERACSVVPMGEKQEAGRRAALAAASAAGVDVSGPILRGKGQTTLISRTIDGLMDSQGDAGYEKALFERALALARLGADPAPEMESMGLLGEDGQPDPGRCGLLRGRMMALLAEYEKLQLSKIAQGPLAGPAKKAKL